MANPIASINAAELGCSDLDEASVAEQLISGLQNVQAQLVLDLRECFLDYGPCSRVTEFLLCRMAATQGSKELIFNTLIDLGSEDAMALLLTKNSEELAGGKREAGEIRAVLVEYCQRNSIDFFVDIFAADADKTSASGMVYRKVKRYELSMLAAQGRA